MRRFVTRTLLFLSLIILIAAIPVFLLFFSRENFFSIDDILKSKEKYLVGYMYNENNYRYMKWEYLNLHEKQEVIIMGSSRVLEMRASMFNASFYNAGWTVSGLNEYKPFLQSLSESKLPNYLLISLDQWRFNRAFDDLRSKPSTESWKDNFTKYPNSIPYEDIFENILSGKYNFKVFFQNDTINKIGLNAFVNSTGVRNDGSLYYGVQIIKLLNEDSTAVDNNNSRTFNKIKNGSGFFKFGDSVNVDAMTVLNDLLQFCKENNIHVIAFLPPFTDKVYRKMTESGNFNYLEKIYPEVSPLFKKYEYELYDFSSVSMCNSSDDETIDGFHGGESTYQRILISMLDSGSILNKVTDSARLRKDLLNRKNRYEVYEY